MLEIMDESCCSGVNMAIEIGLVVMMTKRDEVMNKE